MTDRTLLLRALARVVAAAPAAPVTERLCRGTVGLLGAGGAVLTCAPAGPSRFAAFATDDVAARLDEIEELVGDGPGLRAFRSGRSVGTVLGDPDDAAEDLPVFAVLAGEVADGAVAVRSWPVRSGGSAVAVLTVHGLPLGGPQDEGRGRPSGPGETVQDGQVLADALAPVVVGAGGLDLLDRRVHRAVGMVVAQTGLAPEDATALLRAR
ncbi:hypothetical protein, partial [Cellulomonas triticagri]